MNTCYLPNGSNFIINPDMELEPYRAREAKKMFCLSVNAVDLTTDKKTWTVDNIRKLATGLVEVTVENGKKRATKDQLVERLTEYINEERKAFVFHIEEETSNAKVTLDTCGYSSKELSKLIQVYTGNDLVDAISASILKSNYALSTIVKTIIPDVAKVVNTEYQKPDKSEVMKSIYARFREAVKTVNKETNDGVVDACNERQGTNYSVLYEGCKAIFDNVENASWKELSIAIAFATGRRMAEVHGENTIFEVVDSEHVSFRGQLKTKGRGVSDAYTIPTLYNASTVVRAWQRLRELGKGNFTPAQVNGGVSKGMSTELPGHLRELKKAANISTYKDFRDTYAAKVATTFKPLQMSQNAFLSQIMGHGEGDLVTATTYDKRYIID